MYFKIPVSIGLVFSLLWSAVPFFQTLFTSFPQLLVAAEERISVRESTDELQVAVGQRLFVFGKAKGTLDKVKVGRNLLSFSQVPGAEGSDSKLHKVTWKRLKNGSIQVQSSYDPWPRSLTWTVLSSGELTLETSADPSVWQSGWIGLGFDYPDHLLSQVTWIGGGNQAVGKRGFWKNAHYLQSTLSDQEMGDAQSGFFEPVQSATLEFESITVDVVAKSPGVFFGMGSPAGGGEASPHLNSDLGFLIGTDGDRATFLPQAPSTENGTSQSNSLNPLVLWFHFQ